MQIKIEDFEKCLECWKTLYRLDDGIYKIILRELQNSDLTRSGLALTFIPSLLFSWEGLRGERKKPPHPSGTCGAGSSRL
jgi:hypothetical protein